MLYSAACFTNAQVSLIVFVAVFFACAAIGSGYLIGVLVHKRKRKNLCTEELQKQRAELLDELSELRTRKPVSPPVEEPAPVEEQVPVTEQIPATEVAASAETAEASEEEVAAPVIRAVFGKQIMAVSDLNEFQREKFGFVGEEYDNKRYFVRQSFSFEAKLRASDDEVKRRYEAVYNCFMRYKKVKANRSFRQERIYIGRKTLAVMVFRGKTLCIAFALNPADYAETKYRGEDMSAVKRYANTPMLLRLTSERRLGYAQYLISRLAEINGAEELSSPEYISCDLVKLSRNRLFAENKFKITVLGEVPEDFNPDAKIADFNPFDDDDDFEEETAGGSEIAAAEAKTSAGFRRQIMAVKDMSPFMRETFGFVGGEYDGKRYFVRKSYAFEAKLRASDSEVKQRYIRLIDCFMSYDKVSVKRSFRQERVYSGRKTLALITFRGKTVCVSLALDPAEYEGTKYHGEDMSEIKRYASVPLMKRITSSRRLEYTEYLISRLAENNGLVEKQEGYRGEYDLAPRTRDQSFEENTFKIAILGEVPDGENMD